MLQQLENKVAIITGGSSGIGRTIALAFAREGAAVTVNYVGDDQDEAEDAVKQIEDAGGKAVAVRADVTSQEDVEDLVRKTVEEFGRLDIMVNNAGVEDQMPFLKMPLEVWNKVIAVNLTGTWLGCQVAAGRMVEGGEPGRIINISSIHEERSMPNNSPYCAAKGGVRMLMRTIAVELAPHGITVNNIAPGAIETPINENLEAHPDQKEKLLSEIPLGRMGKPEEVADLALYLASDASAYVTGSTFLIDGGLSRHTSRF
ncbi:MAG: SDR family oxidoreductase [Actinobacteria bacterium]|nr:SDR family oxidoreductase [Actinomycetota bacterium]